MFTFKNYGLTWIDYTKLS